MQSCLDFRLITEPAADVRSFVDWLGNTVHTFDIPEPHHRLVITARSRVITRPADEALWQSLTDAYAPLILADAGEHMDYLQPTHRANFSDNVVAFAESARGAHELRSVVENLSHGLHGRMEYVPGATDVGTLASEALTAARGVCQDYTHIMLAALRWLGVPSRYTSGYFHPNGGDGEVGEQASHAWVEVWFPSHGWIGIDPTNDRHVDDRYVRVAYGRDYADVAPVRGSYRGAETRALDVDVSVAAGLGPALKGEAMHVHYQQQQQ